MNDRKEIDFGSALFMARVVRLKETHRRQPRRDRRQDGAACGRRFSAIVYIFSGFRRRWMRPHESGPKTT